MTCEPPVEKRRVLPNSPSARSLGVRLAALFVALQALFTWLAIPTYTRDIRVFHLQGTTGFATSLLVSSVSGLGLTLLIVTALLKPVRRWLDGQATEPVDAAVIRNVGTRLHRLPLFVGAIWTVQSLWLFGTPALHEGRPVLGLSMVCVAGSVVLSVPVIAGVLTKWLLTSVTAIHSRVARQQHVEIPLVPLRLRTQLLLLGVALCIGPALYMASGVLEPRSAPLPPGSVVQFLCVAFALATACAFAFAEMSSRQLASMTERAREIATQGDVSALGRFPVLQRDEVGELAEGCNAMLDRLEQIDRERSIAVRSLEDSNRTLEREMKDGSECLRETNQRLDDAISAKKAIGEELQRAQKLGSVGRLAAGIAHEINTPLQFVNDNTHFLQHGIRDLTTMIGHYREALEAIALGRPSREVLAEIDGKEDDADLNYLLANLPKALADSVEGLKRVATIARSMKEFSYPDQKEKAPVDLNQAIRATLTIARNEYKYVADVETELGDLPLVNCLAGEINQVILNIVVNASHAIEEVTHGTGKRGRITVRTFEADGFAVITIADTGGGIPDSIRERLFEPFFTTKPIGKGTGQGLAISRSVIVDKHGGQLTFETQIGVGTTFVIRLPLERGNCDV